MRWMTILSGLQGTVSNMLDENVVQPLLVTTSALSLATECVRMILKVSPQHHSSVVSCGKDTCICRTSGVSCRLCKQPSAEAKAAMKATSVPLPGC